ncbi:hypothetical protein Aperf_G00000094437 [Anoplocephala perfoliata]
MKSEDAINALIGGKWSGLALFAEYSRQKLSYSNEASQDNQNPSEAESIELPPTLQDLPLEPHLSKKSLKTLERSMGKSSEAIQHFHLLSRKEEHYEAYLKNSKEISELTAEAYRYLQEKSKFWLQQDSVYSQVITQGRKIAESKITSTEQLQTLQRIVQTLQDISDLQHSGEHEKALRLCSALRKDLKHLSPDFLDLNEVLADLNAFEGVSNYRLQNFRAAQNAFNTQLEICKALNITQHIPRCLEYLGRAYAKLGKFREAKAVWLELLKYDIKNEDKIWINSVISLCSLQLEEYEEAVTNGLIAKQLAGLDLDMKWELRVSILIAKANLSIGNFVEAQTYLQNAQYAAYILNQPKLEEILANAIDNVDKKAAESERKTVAEEHEQPSISPIQEYENLSLESKDDSGTIEDLADMSDLAESLLWNGHSDRMESQSKDEGG